MYKRILVLAAVLVLLICLVAFPAAAESADTDLPYLELMDYILAPIDGSSIGTFYVSGNYDFYGDFSLTLGEISAYGYEITYSYTGNQPSVTGVSFGYSSTNNHTSRFIDSTNIGKIRGTFNGSVGSNFGISFSSSGSYITIHSVRVFTVENYQVGLSAIMSGNGQSIQFVPGNSPSVSSTGYVRIEVDDWRNFDAISLSATIGGYGVTSVTCRLVNNIGTFEYVVPFDMNYINLSNYEGESENTLLALSCDLRGVDPATTPDSTLFISITTAVPSGSYGYVTLTDLYGSVLVTSPDKYIPWFKLLTFSLANIEGVVINDLPSILYNVSNLYTSFIEFRDDFTSVMSNLQTHITSSFDDFKDFWSSSLDEKISSYQEWLARIEYDKWTDWYSPKLTSIYDKLSEIATGTPVDPSVSGGMQAAGDNLSSLGSQISSGTPQISTNVDVVVPEVPDDGSGVLAVTMFDFFWGQNYIIQMLLTVVALATVSYIFFGKKG